MRQVARGWITAALALAAAGCGAVPVDPAPITDAFEPLETPCPVSSSLPHLVAEGARLHLSWVESPDGAAPALRRATLDDGGWSAPETIAVDERMFVNWADFPSLAVAADGTPVAHWLVRDEGGRNAAFAYGIRVARRGADGAWPAGRQAHEHTGGGEHGFVSLVPEPDGSVGIVWLDGGAMEQGGAMELRYRSWDADTLGAETLLDGDVCTCCQTSAALAGDALVVAYRDHAAGEVRDIAIVRRVDGVWSKPFVVHDDGWVIGGCPVNGPALDADGSKIALAWYTEGPPGPQVLVAFSDDAGATFDHPTRLDGGNPLGRVDVVWLPDGRAAVSWLELEGESDRAQLRVRAIGPNGRADTPWVVGATSAARSSGFPRLALWNGRLVLAWTDTGPPERVRLAMR